MKIDLSKIVFGGASLSGSGGGYGTGDISSNEAFELLDSCLESGIRMFDTAPIYGYGRSEEILGEFSKNQRSSIKIITKGGIGWHDNKRVDLSNSPENIEKMLHESILRLGDTYIDYYLIHYPDPNVDIRYSLEILLNAKEHGKILNIGLSNTNQSEIDLASSICDIALVQNECNLFKNDFKNLAPAQFVSVGWGTFDKGILTGRTKPGRQFDKSDFRAWAPWWKKSDWKDRAKAVAEFTQGHENVDIKKLALNYSLGSIDFSICGFKNKRDLEDISHIELMASAEINTLAGEFRDGL